MPDRYRFFVRSALLSVAIAVAAAYASTSCAIGYLHYRQIAVEETLAAQRAERANIDLQDALDRLRDDLTAARARTNTPGNEPSQEIAKAEQYRVDLIAQLARMLEQVPLDLPLTGPQPATFAARLSWEPTNLAGGLQQARASSSIDRDGKIAYKDSPCDTQPIVERDHLRSRVSDLEQQMTLLQSRQAPVACSGQFL